MTYRQLITLETYDKQVVLDVLSLLADKWKIPHKSFGPYSLGDQWIKDTLIKLSIRYGENGLMSILDAVRNLLS